MVDLASEALEMHIGASHPRAFALFELHALLNVVILGDPLPGAAILVLQIV